MEKGSLLFLFSGWRKSTTVPKRKACVRLRVASLSFVHVNFTGLRTDKSRDSGNQRELTYAFVMKVDFVGYYHDNLVSFIMHVEHNAVIIIRFVYLK